MQNQMQILLEQINYPEHQTFLFENKQIEKVDVFRQRQELIFHLLFDQPLLPVAAFYELYQRFDQTFSNISTINKASFLIRYQSTPSKEQILEYWPIVLEYLSRQDLMIRALEGFQVQVNNEELQIAVKDEPYYQEIEQKYAAKIQQCYDVFGFSLRAVKPVFSDQAK